MKALLALVGVSGWFFGVVVFLQAESTFHEQSALLMALIGTVGLGFAEVSRRLDSE